MSPPPIESVLFDLDNTLVDRESMFLRVAEAFYREHTPVAATAPLEQVVELLVTWDEDGYSDREEMLARWLAKWPDCGKTYDTLTSWYRSTMANATRPDSQVNAFLEDLNEKGVPLGIVTNGSSNQRSKCQVAGLDRLVRFIIVSEEAGYKKPDARIFADALDRLGLETPSNVLFVGDHPVNDIDGPKRFGMQTAWVSRGRRYPTDLMRPDHVVDRISDLGLIVGT